MTSGGRACSGVAGPESVAASAFASGAGAGGVSTGGVTAPDAPDGPEGPLACAVFWPGGGAWLLKKYWETNITAPIRTKASRSRTSIDISLGDWLPGPPLTGSAIQRFRKVRSPDGIEPAGLKRMAA